MRQVEFNRDAITGITLISIEEYTAAKEHIPPLNEWWWLRSPGDNGNNAACVDPRGSVHDLGLYVINDDVAVRPALRFNPESCNLQIEDRFEAGGKPWTVIGEGLALCDESFCQMPFRMIDMKTENANDYEASDVKEYLDRVMAGIKSCQEILVTISEMSYAFHTLHDCMKDHMPDYGCGNDEYALGVEEAVTNAYVSFTENEKKVRALIEGMA